MCVRRPCAIVVLTMIFVPETCAAMCPVGYERTTQSYTKLNSTQLFITEENGQFRIFISGTEKESSCIRDITLPIGRESK